MILQIFQLDFTVKWERADNNMMYAFVKEARAHPQASARCRSLGGRLAVPTNASQSMQLNKMAFDNGFTDREAPDDILADVHEHMYQPVYPHYV